MGQEQAFLHLQACTQITAELFHLAKLHAAHLPLFHLIFLFVGSHR